MSRPCTDMKGRNKESARGGGSREKGESGVLAKQAWRARDDLRIVVMSATIDAAPVSAFLDGCAVVDVPGRLFPIEIRYAPQQAVAPAALQALDASSGDVLCFLQGAAEIRRAIAELESRGRREHLDIMPLHGSLDAAAQDAALRPSPSRRRIIVATNVAETSVTVPGVTAVVDAGWHKVARYDAERGIDSLDGSPPGRWPSGLPRSGAGRSGARPAGRFASSAASHPPRGSWLSPKAC